MKGGALWSAPGGARRSARPRTPGSCASDDALVLVGTIDDAVIGFGVVRLERLRDGAHARRDHRAVRRARGAARSAWARRSSASWSRSARSGCVGIDAFALPGHRAAKNFFEEPGFTARAIVMHHRLDDGGTGA